MKFIDAEFVKGFIRMANDGWEQGWHERNGGNLSYRVKPEEVESVKENFEAKKWQPIGTSVPNLAGEYFLVTGSGKYFRNVIIKPEDSICMIELDGLHFYYIKQIHPFSLSNYLQPSYMLWAIFFSVRVFRPFSHFIAYVLGYFFPHSYILPIFSCILLFYFQNG